MRERCEDVDLHEGKLVGLGEPTRHQDAAAFEVDLEDALRDERQRVARVELEDVVRHSGGHVLHDAEPAASLLLHLDADELEEVVAALLDGRKLVPRDGEDGAALDGAVEPDDHPAAGPLRGDDRRSLLPRQQARAHREALGVIARVLDDERAVEAVRAADTADRNEIGHGVYSLTISSWTRSF
jgi:hypothetical protein